MKAIILSGGSGTRLWPMSRQERPKQFFDVIGRQPLIQETYQRLLGFFPTEKIYFSLSAPFVGLLKRQWPALADNQIFIEPQKRDTGPAMGYVAALLELNDPDEPIVFIPSDHYIGNEELFLRCLKAGEALVKENGQLVDIGISPTYPSTVLGYTKIGGVLGEKDGVKIFEFLGHKEKPEYEMAKRYLEEGCYLWHANYYMWTPRRFMEAFETFAPEVGKILRALQKAVQEKNSAAVNYLYEQLPKKSFDYLVTEKMTPGSLLVLRGDFGWSDIGAWDTLYDRMADRGGNVLKGKCIVLETNGSLIYGPPGKLMAVVGMEDVVIVDTGDVLLVCRRKDAQKVKGLVERLDNEESIFL